MHSKNGALRFSTGKYNLNQDRRALMSSEFMKRAIALRWKNVRSGKRRAVRRVIVKESRIIAEGANRVTPSERSHGACGNRGHVAKPCRVLADFQLTGLRSLHDLRALPHVSWPQFIGRAPRASSTRRLPADPPTPDWTMLHLR